MKLQHRTLITQILVLLKLFVTLVFGKGNRFNKTIIAVIRKHTVTVIKIWFSKKCL